MAPRSKRLMSGATLVRRQGRRRPAARQGRPPDWEFSMTAAAELSFIHRIVPATEPGRPPILLLHGTGGDEDDLLPFGALVAPGSALFSPRGKTLEGGMPRFFRRLSEGVF